MECRRLLSYASLVQDINQTSDMLAPSRFKVVGSEAYFAGRGIDGGNDELWKTDGTREGTVLVKEIVPGLAGSSPANFTDVNGTLFFTASDPEAGIELWKSDGTSEGTVRVKDIRPGTGNSSPKNLVNVNGVLYFNADDGTSGAELWMSDGTAAGTVRLKDIRPGSSASDPQYLISYNGVLLFSADDGFAGRELWRSDGAAAGTYRVTDLYSGISASSPRYLVQFDNSIFFTADPSNGRGDLFRTDGTAAGTTRVKEIAFGGTGTSDYSTLVKLTPSGNRLFFLAGNSQTGSYELWSSDGTTAGTGKLAASSYFRNYSPLLAAGANSLVFTNTTTQTGTELWVSDGTVAGTKLLDDLIPGPASGIGSVNFVSFGDAVLFAPNRGDGATDLWRTDLTAAGTVQIADLEGPGLALGYMTALGQQVLFTGLRYVDQGDLYSTDGTAQGTRRIGAVAAGNASSMWEYPTINENSAAFFSAGETMYFAASDGAHGAELWRTEPGAIPGTLGGASMVADIAQGGFGSDPADFASTADGSVYFTAFTFASGRELYRIPIAGGLPQLVADLVPGADSSTPRLLSPAGNSLYFTTYDSGTSTSSFWRYDPASGAPAKVTDGSGHALTRASAMVHFGSYWYFSATGYGTGSELWRVDGKSSVAQLVGDLNSGSGSSFPEHLTVAGGNLYFDAQEPKGGNELWKTDGQSPPVRVLDITPGYTATTFSVLYALDGILYFAALPGTSGASDRLWRSDGTAEGTYPVADVTVTYPRQLTSLGGYLYFTGDDAQGHAIFRYDPSTGGAAVRLTPETTGAGLSLSPRTLYAAGTHVYSTAVAYAADTGHGDHYELWETDGTSTRKVRDLQPIVPSGTSPGLGNYWFAGTLALAANSDYLFFPAWSPESGLEPHALPLADPSGAIQGIVYDDRNANGQPDAGEPGLAGRAVFVDFDGDGVLDADEPTAMTDAAGSYTIDSLDVGSYLVLPVVSAGWVQAGLQGPQSVSVERAAITGITFGLIDVNPPTIVSGAPDPGQPGKALRVSFSKDVSESLEPADLQLTNLTTGQTIDPSSTQVQFDRASLVATFTFAGLANSVLPDGNYIATFPAGTIYDAGGRPLASDVTFDFFSLAGDANHDRSVDFNDLVALAQNYNTSGKTFAQGDFNYDGSVDFNDLVILAQRYNTSLAPPSPAPALAVTKPKDVSLFSQTPITRPVKAQPKHPVTRPGHR